MYRIFPAPKQCTFQQNTISGIRYGAVTTAPEIEASCRDAGFDPAALLAEAFPAATRRTGSHWLRNTLPVLRKAFIYASVPMEYGSPARMAPVTSMHWAYWSSWLRRQTVFFPVQRLRMNRPFPSEGSCSISAVTKSLPWRRLKD